MLLHSSKQFAAMKIKRFKVVHSLTTTAVAKSIEDWFLHWGQLKQVKKFKNVRLTEDVATCPLKI